MRGARIIHGKGYRSANSEPVLKRKVGTWLTQRDAVLAYEQARPADGSRGLVVVVHKDQKPETVGNDVELNHEAPSR